MWIYKITNIQNNKSYIGQSIRPIEQRFHRHINDALNNILDTHFARAIRAYGKENFKIEVIDTDKKTKSENINIIKLEDEIEIKRIEINKNLFVRLLESNGEMVVDFCKFYKGFPTKKNIRINLNKFKKLNELLS